METQEQLFDQYLKGELSVSEKLKLEQRLQSDPDFKFEFDLHQDISKTVKFLARESIKEQLQEIEYNLKTDNKLDDYTPSKGGSGGAGSIWIWVVFALVGIGIALATYFVSNDPVLVSGKEYFKKCTALYVKIIDDREMANHRIAFNHMHHDSATESTIDKTSQAELAPVYFRDTVNICIIYGDSFNFHYTYTDTLTLYGNLQTDLVNFVAKPENKYGGYYNLMYNGEVFELKPNTTKITPLVRLKQGAQAKQAGGHTNQPKECHDEKENIIVDKDTLVTPVLSNKSKPVKVNIDNSITSNDIVPPAVVKVVMQSKNGSYTEDNSIWGQVKRVETIGGKQQITRIMYLKDLDKFKEQCIIISIEAEGGYKAYNDIVNEVEESYGNEE